jgi:4-hydroxybenzoyl-CoA reductase subunit beta
MIRLPRFTYVAPRTLPDAAARLADAPTDTMLLGGGTDLVPNMKRRQQTPRVVIGLRAISALHGVHRNGALTIGAMTTLGEIVGRDDVRRLYPGLWQAAVQVATPQLRNMGTIGGNLCLDTRCTYYDQSLEWRQAINYCMKKDGDTCWVATSSPKCLAVSSTDTAPMLQALGARVRLVSTHGERVIDVGDLFNNDGMAYLTRRLIFPWRRSPSRPKSAPVGPSRIFASCWVRSHRARSPSPPRWTALAATPSQTIAFRPLPMRRISSASQWTTPTTSWSGESA